MSNRSPAVISTNTQIMVGGVDISGDANDVSFDMKRPKLDVTTFGTDGHEYILQPVEGTFGIKGYFNKTAGMSDDVLGVGLLDGTIQAAELDVPDSNAGSVSYAANTLVSDYSVNPKVLAAIPFSATLDVTGPITRAVLT